MSNSKRCSSGTGTNSFSSSRRVSSLTRSKTCAFTGSKMERLEPITTPKSLPTTTDQILDDTNGLHPAMITDLCWHSRDLLSIPVMSQFNKLQILDLSCNNLTRIENLKALVNLRELKLYGNRIERIENLESLTSLQILHLQYNQISTIGSGLATMTRLQSLRLDTNRLKAIRADEMLKMVQLKNLDVSDCSLENIDFVNTLSSLVELRACHCGLTHLPNQFRALRNLVDIDLSENELTNVVSLKSLASSVRILRLSKNQLQDIQILASLIHLIELDVSDNRLVNLPNSLEKLIDLQCLHAANNRLTTWNDIDVIRRLNSLFDIDLSGNPLISQTDNFVERLCALRPTLELINDKPLRQDMSEVAPSASDDQLAMIDKELREIDQSLERSMADVQSHFDTITNDLQQLRTSIDVKYGNGSDRSPNSTPSDRKTKHRLFQALTFSEENYSKSEDGC